MYLMTTLIPQAFHYLGMWNAIQDPVSGRALPCPQREVGGGAELEDSAGKLGRRRPGGSGLQRHPDVREPRSPRWCPPQPAAHLEGEREAGRSHTRKLLRPEPKMAAAAPLAHAL